MQIKLRSRTCTFTQRSINLTVEEIIVHENFGAKTNAYDIALVRTAETIEFSSGKVTKIKLPTTNHSAKGGVEADILGFG